MRRTERIVVAFGPLGEAGQPATGAEGANAIAAAGQDLVRIGLMADVPDQTVARGVEHIVQRRRQFDDAEAGAEMPARDRDGIDGILSRRYSNFACRDKPSDVRWVAHYQRSESLDTRCQLGSRSLILKA